MADSTSADTLIIDKTPLWLSVVGKAAPISSILLYMAPIPTVQEFSRRKLVGDLPLLPYTSMLSNSFAWVVYGLMNSEPKLWTANGIGLILSIYYFLSFARFAPVGASTLPGTFDQHVQGFVSVLAFVLWFAKSKKSGPIGKMGVLINLAMYASPLAAIKAVLETKSSEAIPLPLTVASLASCILWTITGYMDMHDPYVWIPCCFGIIFGLAQVGLKISIPEVAGKVGGGIVGDDSAITGAPELRGSLSPDLSSTEMVMNDDLPS